MRPNSSLIKTKNLLILIGVLILTGCHTYKKYDKESFPNYVWSHATLIIFKPTIEDINKEYQLIFGVRHLYGLQVNNLNLTLTKVTPSGEQSQQDFDFKIKNNNGEYVGKCAGDLCDLETVIINNLKFEEAGEYTFVVDHNEGSDILGVIEFGLIIDEK